MPSTITLRRETQLPSHLMEQSSANFVTQRYALVTGANKGIGFEICRQLASKGITVILTSRDEKRGIQAQQNCHSHNVVFHQLDVADPDSIAAIVDFIKTKYGRLDILVNNAAILGIEVEGDVEVFTEAVELELLALSSGGKPEPLQLKAKGRIIETLEAAEECIRTNYYGAKRLTQALTPLLRASHSPRIVIVSGTLGTLKFLLNEWAKGLLGDEDGLTEEGIDDVVQEFLKSFREGSLEANSWPSRFAAYKVSKAALNAYTRCIAKKYPSFYVNSVCPGYTRTDMTCNLGELSAEEAAQVPVKMALLPDGGPSGMFFDLSRREELLSM